MVDFLFALIELFFRYLLRFRSYEAKCVQLGCFRTVVDLFCTQILPGQRRPPSTILGIGKLQTLG